MAHVHAEKIIEYGKDALQSSEPWYKWQFKREGWGWIDCHSHLVWHPSVEYRRKPETVLFCGRELPKPETEAPEKDQLYYTPHTIGGKRKTYAVSFHWIGSESDLQYLESNRVFLKEKDAALWGRAIEKAINDAVEKGN